MKPIDVLSTFFHMPNVVVLSKRIKVPKARRSRIQVIEMKRWPHTYSYRQTTLDHFESRDLCFAQILLEWKSLISKGKTPHTFCSISLFHVETMKRSQCKGCWDPVLRMMWNRWSSLITPYVAFPLILTMWFGIKLSISPKNWSPQVRIRVIGKWHKIPPSYS